MLNQNYTAKLLNLEDVIITNVENIFEEFHIYIELPRKKAYLSCLRLCLRPCTRLSDADDQGCSAGKKYLPAPS